jgi:hypothetical protein
MHGMEIICNRIIEKIDGREENIIRNTNEI